LTREPRGRARSTSLRFSPRPPRAGLRPCCISVSLAQSGTPTERVRPLASRLVCETGGVVERMSRQVCPTGDKRSLFSVLADENRRTPRRSAPPTDVRQPESRSACSTPPSAVGAIRPPNGHRPDATHAHGPAEALRYVAA